MIEVQFFNGLGSEGSNNKQEKLRGEKKVKPPNTIRAIVLDVMKPHNPSIIDVTNRLAILTGVSGVNTTLEEVDQHTRNIKITIEGGAIPYREVQRVIEDCGGSVHSIDMVSTGRSLVREAQRPKYWR